MNNQYSNNTVTINPKTYLKTLSLIHIALMSGILIFGLVALYVTPKNNLYFSFSNDMLFLGIFIFILMIVFMFGLVFKSILKQNAKKQSNDLNQALIKYQTTLIIRIALIEGPSLFGVVVFLLSGNLIFLSGSALLLTYMYFQKPSREKIIKELNFGNDLILEFEKFEEGINY